MICGSTGSALVLTKMLKSFLSRQNGSETYFNRYGLRILKYNQCIIWWISMTINREAIKSLNITSRAIWYHLWVNRTGADLMLTKMSKSFLWCQTGSETYFNCLHILQSNQYMFWWICMNSGHKTTKSTKRVLRAT